MTRPLTRSVEDRRELIQWAVACAQRILPIFEAAVPGDARPADALAGAQAFARGGLRIGEVRELAIACHAAAREAPNQAATGAARVCAHTAAIAHMASHARGVAYYTRKALEATNPEEPDVVEYELS